MPARKDTRNGYIRFLPSEVLGEILQFACGEYFDPDRPFTHDDVRFNRFIANRTAFVSGATSWRNAAFAAGQLWSALIVRPKQRKARFAFLVSRMKTEPVHIWVKLRGPEMCMPPPTASEVSIRDIVRLLEHKSSVCATLGIFSEDQPLFTYFADMLTTYQFPLLTALTIANIEPCVDRDGRTGYQPSNSILNGRQLSHLRLVGFGLSLAASDVFAHVCVLVLSDLVSDVAPTTRELAAFLLCATRLQALSIDRVECLGAYETSNENTVRLIAAVCAGHNLIILEHLEMLHFFCGGNVGLRALILLLRAPNLTTFDAKVVLSDDARFIEECGNLLKPVANLRVYGIHSSAKMIFSLMNLMPGVTDIDLTTSARSFAACLSGYGRGWPLLSTIRLEDPAFRDVASIVGTLALNILQIYYTTTSRRMRRTEEAWVRSEVSVLELPVRAEDYWYSNYQ
ncbi:hypothetical protein B0H14DRAFT_3424551 [Mycena olivaceomarginata]|nr:hypothetical protein B0H14DRAFT_3424551 [Mycena olivaceomarginata]